MEVVTSDGNGRITGEHTGEATVWVSYAEGARRLGIKPESFKRRALERRWPRKPGNDGRALVAVPGEVFSEVTRESTSESPGDFPGAITDDVGSDDNALAEHLKSELEDARRELRSVRAEAVEAQGRAAKAEAEAEHQGRAAAELRKNLTDKTAELEARRTEAAEARERAARAEGELAGIRSRGLLARLWSRG